MASLITCVEACETPRYSSVVTYRLYCARSSAWAARRVRTSGPDGCSDWPVSFEVRSLEVSCGLRFATAERYPRRRGASVLEFVGQFDANVDWSSSIKRWNLANKRRPPMSATDRQSRSMDRRLSVAPMMDWTDNHHCPSSIRYLPTLRIACLLYVSSSFVRAGQLGRPRRAFSRESTCAESDCPALVCAEKQKLALYDERISQSVAPPGSTQACGARAVGTDCACA
jgi:hypothetical protein